MQHLNYCRQALVYFENNPPLIPSYLDMSDSSIDDYYEYSLSVIKEMSSAIKFNLPQFGRVLDDRSLSAIQEASCANLPFPIIALEYSKPIVNDTEDTMSCSKRITLAKDYEKRIAVVSISYSDSAKRWGIFHPVFIEKDGIKPGLSKKEHAAFAYSHGKYVDKYFEDDASCVLDFLNALACNNVHIEKSPAKSTKLGKKVKTALPFDDYHFLTVDVPGKAGVRGEVLGGSHRSPREHLRRGHIRRLESGPIWVNACVVNAGIGSKVGKSYLLRKSA